MEMTSELLSYTSRIRVKVSQYLSLKGDIKAEELVAVEIIDLLSGVSNYLGRISSATLSAAPPGFESLVVVDIQSNYNTATQAAYFLFQQLLPPIHSLRLNSTEVKLWCFVLQFYCKLVEVNPTNAMSSWPLFLNESISVENRISQMFDFVVTQYVGTDSISTPAPLTARSPILSAVLTAHYPEIAMAGMKCIRALLTGLSLQPWFKSRAPGSQQPAPGDATTALMRSRAVVGVKLTQTSFGDKITTTVLKLLKVIVILLNSDSLEPAMLQELLLTSGSVLIDLPLQTLAYNNLNHERIGDHISLDTTPALEIVAQNVFSSVMRIASSIGRPLMQSPSLSLSNSAAALNWLLETCKRMRPLMSFYLASRLRPVSASSSSISASASASASVSEPSLGAADDSSSVEYFPFYQLVCEWGIVKDASQLNRSPQWTVVSISRQLTLTLLMVYPQLYLSEKMWMRHIFHNCLHHPDDSVRELGFKMLTEVIKATTTLRSASPGPSSAGDVFSLAEMTPLLWTACNDADHKVRAQAIVAIGQMSSDHWKELCSMNASVLSAEVFAVPESVAEVMFQLLLLRTRDALGAVRAVAFRALGEAIGKGVLVEVAAVQRRVCTATSLQALRLLLSEINPQPFSDVQISSVLMHDSREVSLENMFIHCAKSCVDDSKLAVRLQATFAFGSFLLYLLPLRTRYISGQETIATGSLIEADLSAVDLVCDESWMSNVAQTLTQLDDSDKVLASATRCLGLLASGLRAEHQLQANALSAIMNGLIRKFLLGRRQISSEELAAMNSGSQGGAISRLGSEAQLQRSIATQPKKVIFSLGQALGLISRVFMIGESTATEISESRVEDVKLVLAAMVRYGNSVKVRLQAAKGLVFMYGDRSSFAGESESSGNLASRASLSQCYGRQQDSFLCVLESALLLSTSFKASISATSTGTSVKRGVAGAHRVDDSIGRNTHTIIPKPERAPKLQLREGLSDALQQADSSDLLTRAAVGGRSNALQRTTLVLLWILLRKSECYSSVPQEALQAFRSNLLKTILHYADQLVMWMEVIQRDLTLVTSFELSLSSLPTVITVPTGLLPEGGVSCQVLCKDISNWLLKLVDSLSGRREDSLAQNESETQDSLFHFSFEQGFGGVGPLTADSDAASMLTSSTLSKLNAFSRDCVVTYWGSSSVHSEAVGSQRSNPEHDLVFGLNESPEVLLGLQPASRSSAIAMSTTFVDDDDEDEI